MRRFCGHAALVLLAVSASSCYALAYAYLYTVALFDPDAFEGWGAASGKPGVRAVITGVTQTPREVHVGQTVLLDYTLGTVTFDETSAAGAPIPPRLSATAGQVLPLLPSVYMPPGPNPELGAVQSSLSGYTEPYGDSGALDLAIRANGHAYLLFVAPTTPGLVTVVLAAGAPRPPLPEEATRELVISVLP